MDSNSMAVPKCALDPFSGLEYAPVEEVHPQRRIPEVIVGLPGANCK